MITSQIFSCPAPPTQSISLYYYTALQENTFLWIFLLLFLLGSKRAESCAGEAIYSWKTFKATLNPCASDELICQVILPSNYDILNPKCRNRKFILCKFITCHTDGAASFCYWCSINQALPTRGMKFLFLPHWVFITFLWRSVWKKYMYI